MSVVNKAMQKLADDILACLLVDEWTNFDCLWDAFPDATGQELAIALGSLVGAGKAEKDARSNYRLPQRKPNIEVSNS